MLVHHLIRLSPGTSLTFDRLTVLDFWTEKWSNVKGDFRRETIKKWWTSM